MDLFDDRWLCEDENVAVALQIASVRCEPLAAEPLFGEAMPLDHRAHRTIEDEDALCQRGMQMSDTG